MPISKTAESLCQAYTKPISGGKTACIKPVYAYGKPVPSLYQMAKQPVPSLYMPMAKSAASLCQAYIKPTSDGKKAYTKPIYAYGKIGKNLWQACAMPIPSLYQTCIGLGISYIKPI